MYAVCMCLSVWIVSVCGCGRVYTRGYGSRYRGTKGQYAVCAHGSEGMHINMSEKGSPYSRISRLSPFPDLKKQLCSDPMYITLDSTKANFFPSNSQFSLLGCRALDPS